MKIAVTEDLRSIAKEIMSADKTDEEWAEIESDDMFQAPSLTGGFDATERAFCFSLYTEDGLELWFQVTTEELRRIAEGGTGYIEVRPAE